ncbi:MAG: hypothetical protein GX116_07805 [Fibrobacter sp.]|nr:hypothetical protein [Fibrobacter sp.]
MSLTALFTLIIAFVILRSTWLRWKVNQLDHSSFQELEPRLQLAVLKEKLLEKPSEQNLMNLKEYGTHQGLCVDIDSYRPLILEQIQISKSKNAIALDQILYTKQSEWVDSITPLEFELANKAKNKGDLESFIHWSLEGVLRLYSDKKIESSLEALIDVYPKAKLLLSEYLKLKDFRDNSPLSEAVIEELKDRKKAWLESFEMD